MTKFFFESNLEASGIEPISQKKTSKKKYQNSGSEKFYKMDVSDLFDPEETISTESIRDWVGHFYKILNTRKVSIEDSNDLPHQEELEMRIYKEAMERKFLSFTD